MPVTKRESRLSAMRQVCFQVEDNTAQSDIELFEEAVKWLKENQDYTLLEVQFNPETTPERTKLILFVEWD